MQPDRPMIIGNIPKLPAKWATVVMPFMLSCLMSGIISFINMLRNLGWIDGFISLWLIRFYSINARSSASSSKK